MRGAQKCLMIHSYISKEDNFQFISLSTLPPTIVIVEIHSNKKNFYFNKKVFKNAYLKSFERGKKTGIFLCGYTCLLKKKFYGMSITSLFSQRSNEFSVFYNLLLIGNTMKKKILFYDHSPSILDWVKCTQEMLVLYMFNYFK